MEFKGFDESHVGAEVTDIITSKTGKIKSYLARDKFCVIVSSIDGGQSTYTKEGLYYESNKMRRLYFGHNIKVEVTGEEVPEPKLICPVCNSEHELERDPIDNVWDFDCGKQCPFFFAGFHSEENAELAMKSLIKAMDK